MSVIGRFLEFGIHTPDILESLGFYKRLGFTELTTNDVWSHRYAVVSDGVINIGLHDRVFDSPTLTFVHPDLASYARTATSLGHDFSFLRLDEDVFNEIGFVDREGHALTMLEARTFMMADEDLPDSSCGRFFEVSLPVRSTVRAGHFWAPLIPNMSNMREEPTMHMRFESEPISIGLSESIALSSASLSFRCDDKAALNRFVEDERLEIETYPGFEGAFAVLTAPEGTRIYVFDEDFLDASYTVEETDEESGPKDEEVNL